MKHFVITFLDPGFMLGFKVKRYSPPSTVNFFSFFDKYTFSAMFECFIAKENGRHFSDSNCLKKSSVCCDLVSDNPYIFMNVETFAFCDSCN